ncbi:DUF7577 domain-containing protein [Haloarcula laminariae]|uniref:DUF7577 domain-containing protein n=1 Tax=Haloarcula laminariae TaxID=2961577 RepID=UPI002404C6B7|nr:hypothetical protein [Halomicroarcula sp. FL173]
MVTAGELYVFTATVMALVALAAAVPVLRDIAIEGRERLRRDGPDPPVEDAQSSEVAGVRCQHCGTENETDYTYCAECSRAL